MTLCVSEILTSRFFVTSTRSAQRRNGVFYSSWVLCCGLCLFVFVLFAGSNVCMTQIAQILCMTQMSKKWPNLIKMSGVCPLRPELGLMQFLIEYWIVISGKSQNALSTFSVSGLLHFLGEIYFHFFVTTFISLQPRTAAQWNANKAFLQTKVSGIFLH